MAAKDLPAFPSEVLTVLHLSQPPSGPRHPCIMLSVARTPAHSKMATCYRQRKKVPDHSVFMCGPTCALVPGEARKDAWGEVSGSG